MKTTSGVSVDPLGKSSHMDSASIHLSIHLLVLILILIVIIVVIIVIIPFIFVIIAIILVIVTRSRFGSSCKSLCHDDIIPFG